jgi:uncharacterized protein
MLIEVQAFCDRVERDLNGLIDELQDITGRYGDEERRAWRASLERVSVLLAKPQLSDFRQCHLHLGQRGGLSLEYRLPASSSWCDVVLLGRGERGPAAVLIELKHWDTAGDRPGPSERLIQHAGEPTLHPSDQVRSYTEYCRRFHSAVFDNSADLAGCVYFTRAVSTHAYRAPPHDQLVATFPIFTDAAVDTDERFPAFLSNGLRSPDQDFANRFERGVYRQDRDFCQQMAQQIADPATSPFELLDEQRRGFELCWVTVRSALEGNNPVDDKTVMIIEGPPGSGKSVIAARLWAALINARVGDRGVVLTTTSSSQRSNWEHLFQKAARNVAGSGVVIPANRYAPESTVWVGKYNKRHGSLEVEQWRENTSRCRELEGRLRCPDDSFDVSIVDEAHALINPEQAHARVGPTGWPSAFGPQAFHIIRSSRVSIFLMDSEQSFRDRETTTREDISRWAVELGAKRPPPISLAGQQFRSAGSAEYMDWLENCLGIGSVRSTGSWRWRAAARGLHDASAIAEAPASYTANPASAAIGRGMTFEVVNDPVALEEALRVCMREGHTARLVAPYGRPWKTKKKHDPHALPPGERDFDIRFERGNVTHRWSKIWNYAPGEDYTLFVQAPPGTRMHDDPLCEVGCPYVVRGFDYGYLGVLWLKDLVYRGGRWTFDLSHIHESGLVQSKAAAKREHRDGPASRELLRRLQQVYRILLSRALRGIYVWFEDEETRKHVSSLLPA